MTSLWGAAAATAAQFDHRVHRLRTFGRKYAGPVSRDRMMGFCRTGDAICVHHTTSSTKRAQIPEASCLRMVIFRCF
jgi:hypothetical protein